MRNKHKKKQFGGAKVEALAFGFLFFVTLYAFWGCAAMMETAKHIK